MGFSFHIFPPKSVCVLVTDWALPGSNPCGDKRYCSSSKNADGLWGPASLLFRGHRRSSLGVKWQGPQIDELLPTGAEVKYEWSCSALPLICLYCVNMENFFFLPLSQVCHTTRFLSHTFPECEVKNRYGHKRNRIEPGTFRAVSTNPIHNKA